MTVVKLNWHPNLFVSTLNQLEPSDTFKIGLTCGVHFKSLAFNKVEYDISVPMGKYEVANQLASIRIYNVVTSSRQRPPRH